MNEAKSEQAAFRVGGVYRNRRGEVVVIAPMDYAFHRERWERARPGHCFGGAERVEDRIGVGYVSLVDGRYVEDIDGGRHGWSLIPGELTLRDGQWVPVEEAKPADDFLDAAAYVFQGWERLINRRSAADPSAAMIASDGPAKPAVAAIPSAPKPPAKPAMSGLTLSPDLRATSHLVEPVHGSVALVRELRNR